MLIKENNFLNEVFDLISYNPEVSVAIVNHLVTYNNKKEPAVHQGSNLLELTPYKIGCIVISYKVVEVSA